MLDRASACELRDVITIKHGFAFSSDYFVDDGDHVLLTPGNFREEGGFRWLGDKQKFYNGPLPDNFVLSAGDMLVAMTEQAPGLLGSTFFVPADRIYLHNQRLGLIQVTDHNRVDAGYLHYFFASTPVRRAIFADATGTKVKHTSPDKILSLEAVLPPLPEQRKIAEILRTWDEAIEVCERLRQSKACALAAARQKVFGRDGLPPSRWRSEKLDTLVERIRRQSDGGEHPVMTISGRNGFMRQDEKFDRFMAGDSVDRYLLLKRGEFAYNKGNSKTYPQGCIYRLEQETALVPFVYYAFALREGLDSEFYAHLFEAGFLNHQLSRLINSGVRNDGLLNIYADDFFGCVVPLPPKPEQTQIAAYFRLAKQELSALDQQIEALRQQKRGLMQKLLTGKWRVKVKEAV
jgi:type I restriction enzyme S subunit